jgi:hypothetical protein
VATWSNPAVSSVRRLPGDSRAEIVYKVLRWMQSRLLFPRYAMRDPSADDSYKPLYRTIRNRPNKDHTVNEFHTLYCLLVTRSIQPREKGTHLIWKY